MAIRKEALGYLIQAFNQFRALNNSMHVPTALVFMQVAMRPGTKKPEIQKRLSLSTSEASVNGSEGGTAKKKKSNNSSKTTKPTSVETTAVEASTQKTRGRCQIGNNGRCIAAPLKTSEKDCIVSANNTKPYKPCVMRNYRSKKKS